MLEIISICLNIITIGLTIYELFSKKSSNGTKQYIQNYSGSVVKTKI